MTIEAVSGVRQTIKLDGRLRTIAGFIENGSAVADIGTDHGMIPVYLAQNGLARSIIASDISAGALGAARRTAEKYGVTDSITFVIAPGLAGADAARVDTVVLSGIGGDTIADILSDAPWTKDGKRLVLQPQSKIEELYHYLRDNGYAVYNVKLAREGGRFYVVIHAGGCKAETELSAETGLSPEMELYTRLIAGADPLFEEYIDHLLVKTRRVIKDIGKTDGPEYAKLALKFAMYSGLKEAYLKCQQ